MVFKKKISHCDAFLPWQYVDCMGISVKTTELRGKKLSIIYYVISLDLSFKVFTSSRILIVMFEYGLRRVIYYFI